MRPDMSSNLQPFTNDVLARAIRGAAESPGETLWSLLFAALVAFGFWFLRCRREGRQILSLPTGWRSGVLDWVGVVTAAFVVVFAMKVVPAVYERDGAQQTIIDRLQIDLERARAFVAPPIVAENPDHTGLVAEVTQLRQASAAASAEIAEVRSELRTATASLVASQSQVIDLQQQLARVKQPPAVVVRGGSGVAVNQVKMTAMAASLEAGRKIYRAAPRRDAAEDSLKPWIDSVNRWYSGVLALLKEECTPQAVAVVQDRSGQLSMFYGGIHQNEEVQSTHHAMDRILGNLSSLLQRPEMCP